MYTVSRLYTYSIYAVLQKEKEEELDRKKMEQINPHSQE